MDIIRIVALERDNQKGEDIPNSKIIFLVGVDEDLKINANYQWFGYLEWEQSRMKNEMPFVLRDGKLIHWKEGASYGKHYGTNISQKKISIGQYFEVDHRNSYCENWLYRISSCVSMSNCESK